MKNYADLGGCYPPQPSASADNTLLDLHNSSYHTQPHPIIAKYCLNSRFQQLFLILHWELVYIYFTERKLLLNPKREKMIVHHTHLRENEDLPRWCATAIKKKKLSYLNVCALYHV